MVKAKDSSAGGSPKAPANAGERISSKKDELMGVPGFEPALIDGEDIADYEEFRNAALEAIVPKDAIERVWLQDFLDYTWEAQRLRRLKAAMLQSARKEAVLHLIQRLTGSALSHADAVKTSEDWSSSGLKSRKYVDDLLNEHGLTQDAIMAQVMLENIDTLQTIDKLITSYDYRRDAAIRELEKRRDMLAKRAREYARSLDKETELEIIDAAQ